MKKYLVLVLVLLPVVFPVVSFSQLKGKVVTLSDDSLCSSSLHFTSDSIAYYLTGCGDNELLTQLHYAVNDFGYVNFQKVPDSLYNPVICLQKADVNTLKIDSATVLPALFFLDKGKVITESEWLFWGTLPIRSTGRDLNLIPPGFYTDSTSLIWFTDLFRLNQDIPKYRFTDFKGEGSNYIVHVDLPPDFGNGREMMYSSDFFDLSELNFRVINGELHTWITPEWIPVFE